ncbi:13568_t:CDS:2 [Entrophospora sp. SA101]|nr:13568_t:CDS:2 [Entrophospora sp. SA101]
METTTTVPVELGFAELSEVPLTSDIFPSKIGGKPAWLNPKHILSFEQVKCGICERPMILLVQNGSCHKQDWHKCQTMCSLWIIRVKRMWEVWNELLLFKRTSNKSLEYWKTQKLFQKILFPEYEIITEPEEIDNVEEKNLSYLSSSPKKDSSEEFDDIYENSKVKVDKAFLKFQKRIQLFPKQILRYSRLHEDDKNPDPLWVSDNDKPGEDDIIIPKCSNCGQERTFEFQVLSTLLNYLKIDHTKLDSLDWGTLLIYSCKDSCHSENNYYLEEFIYRQDFSGDGVHNKQLVEVTTKQNVVKIPSKSISTTTTKTTNKNSTTTIVVDSIKNSATKDIKQDEQEIVEVPISEPFNSFLNLNTHDTISPLNIKMYTCPNCHTPNSVNVVKNDDNNSANGDYYTCLSHGNYGCGWKGEHQPNEENIAKHVFSIIGFKPLIIN